MRARGSVLHRPNLARRRGGALSSEGLCPHPHMSLTQSDGLGRARRGADAKEREDPEYS